MDWFMTAVISGIVFTVIVTIVAVYFAGGRERQEQSYEEQRNEQEQRENGQQEENERRATVFAEISRQAHSVVRGYESLLADIESLIKFLERDYRYNFYTFPEVEIHYRKLTVNWIQDYIAIGDKIESLWDYYQTKKTFLDPTSRSVVAALIKAANEHYEQAEARRRAKYPEGVSTESDEPSQMALRLQEIQDEIRDFEEMAARRRQVVSYNIHKLIAARSEKKYATSEWRTRQDVELPDLKAGLEAIRGIDFQTHLAAVEDEAERLARRARNF